MKKIFIMILVFCSAIPKNESNKTWPPEKNTPQHHYYCLLHGLPGLTQDHIRAIVEGRMKLIPVVTKQIIPMQLIAFVALGAIATISHKMNGSKKRDCDSE